jgi:hypothetical protein
LAFFSFIFSSTELILEEVIRAKVIQKKYFFSVFGIVIFPDPDTFDDDRQLDSAMSFHLIGQEMENFEDQCFISDQEWKMVSEIFLKIVSVLSALCFSDLIIIERL